MLRLIVLTGCLAVVSEAFVSPMGLYTGAGGYTLDFNRFRNSPKVLESICNAAVMQNGGLATDRLSDVMRSAVDYLSSALGATANPAALGAGSPKWSCLLQASTANGMNPGNAANGVGDYYDTVVELPINQYLPFAFNPCEMVFCGEQGMNPMAIATEVARRLQFGQPLGTMANQFGSFANQLNQPRRGMTSPFGSASPMGGAGGGLAGMMQQAMSAMQGGAAAGAPAAPQNPMANMMSMLQKFQSMMANSATAARPPAPAPANPPPLPTPDAAAAGAAPVVAATPTGNTAPSAAPTPGGSSGFLDILMKMQQMQQQMGGGGAAGGATPYNPLASMMGGSMPSMAGGGGGGGMGGLMGMMAMDAALQDAPDFMSARSPFGFSGMGGMGGMGGLGGLGGMPTGMGSMAGSMG